ncbi:MAG TPA: SOS response-associated peptidase [Gammaproteobacteria bacterium]|nr:SOS response-associated peptidase [Gammaproteobacteria bacterium]
MGHTYRQVVGDSINMCGRYTSRFSDKQNLPASVVDIPRFKARYNIAPQQKAAIIRMLDGQPSYEELRWGFRPSWLKDKNKAQINARAETLFTKPMFKHSALHRRCLVLASGWYEWQQGEHGKQPYVFHLQDDPLFAFAGIWTRWHTQGQEQEDSDSYAIVTTDANPVAAPVHRRMPVVLAKKTCAAWLDEAAQDIKTLSSLLTPYSGDDLHAYPVSTYVNSPQHTGEECIKPLQEL